jgi:hypothetical protein
LVLAAPAADAAFAPAAALAAGLALLGALFAPLGLLLPAAADWLPLLAELPEAFVVEDPAFLSCAFELFEPALLVLLPILVSPLCAGASL